jgi:hypothetical protein
MLNEDLRRLLINAVACANPSGSFTHPLDEDRLREFFDACTDAGIEVTTVLIDANWPMNTTDTMGGDPAHSPTVKAGAYRVLADWLSGR